MDLIQITRQISFQKYSSNPPCPVKRRILRRILEIFFNRDVLGGKKLPPRLTDDKQMYLAGRIL